MQLVVGLLCLPLGSFQRSPEPLAGLRRGKEKGGGEEARKKISHLSVHIVAPLYKNPSLQPAGFVFTLHFPVAHLFPAARDSRA